VSTIPGRKSASLGKKEQEERERERERERESYTKAINL
jgi:hypothetical protein